MKLALALLLSVTAAASLAAKPAPRPNILYFYADDMGWGSIGPNGQAEREAKGLPYVRTPNLDQLAARGINFTRGYGCHVCSPARSSQQSGFHQGHTFADRNDPDNAKKAMRSDDILMGDALSAAGYTTGYWGKWGYGGSKDMDNPTIDNVQTLPTSHGYEFVLAELHHVRAHTFFQPTLWSAPAKKGAEGGLELVPNSMAKYQNNNPAYPNSPANQNHPDYPKANAYCDDAYAFAALDFVRDHAKAYNQSGKPFFGLLAVQIPHAPFDEVSKLPEWDAAYRDDKHFAKLPKQAQQWAAMVTRIDAHFGNILAALEDPNGDGDKSDSVAENTLVIFQSDNGGPGGANNTVFDANGGLRGTKGSIYEGGIRVPLIMRWPAKINGSSGLRPGKNVDRIVDVTDLLPTFCELAGAEIPLGLDGVSIAPLLVDTWASDQRKREFIIHEAGNGQSIIRGKYKLIRRTGGAGKKKKDPAGADKFEIYNLQEDPGEKNDFAHTGPDYVEKLKTPLLAERVNEPRGFANTYHRWTGKDGAITSDPDNWSDYEYSNAGISYLTDAGTPRLSWIAKIENTGKNRSVARADTDLEFLGLEVGGKSAQSVQALNLDPQVNLTGRNQIRLARYGMLGIDGGTVTTMRWIDITPRGILSGHGKIVGDVHSSGTVVTSEKGPLSVSGDFHQSADGTLVIVLDGKPAPRLQISGTARLFGSLELKSAPGFTPGKGAAIPIITSKNIAGKFQNPNKHVIDGKAYEIRFTDTAITLTATE